MADFSTLARPYAKAAFELARDSGDYQSWSDALQAIAGLVTDPQVAQLVSNPALARADLAATLSAALSGKIGKEPLALLQLLIENGRLGALGSLVTQFEALRAEAQRRVEVDVTSAAAVEPAQQQALSDAIRKRLDRDVAVRWHVDPALVGGAVIRAGDLIIDGSLSGELERLQTALAR
ncbi:F-type H+-transporting ATPase subunit delta [Solimonas aquatica]|uniref:ATP synthase subunit delta n=1 Tax=Solimonas aquatica TaxID=489703 RepID=A0A1H9J9X5_9GAMM|nr:F0F1 ATP synthase subunit delta [Solimonas aquatica]SEQ83529.1 F-type H+-transporting ATPase subunit delta [Solimonas aquatica]